MCHLSKMYIFNDMYITSADTLENTETNWSAKFWSF